MKVKIIGLSGVTLSAASFAVLLHAAPPAAGPAVDITAPADNSRLPWNAQAPYAVTASYDGKSTRYGELPANAVVVRATYLANADAPSARRTAPLPEALVQISQSNCMGCHDFDANVSGPSFAAIARRYAHQPGAVASLAGHIRNGESGAWGMGAMPRHPGLSMAQTTAIAQWIITHGNDPTTHYSIGKSGSFRMSAPGKPGPRAGIALSAFYTGPLKPGDTRVADTVIIHGAGS